MTKNSWNLTIFFDKFQFREFDIFFRIFREFAVVKNQQKCLIRIFHEFSKIKRWKIRTLFWRIFFCKILFFILIIFRVTDTSVQMSSWSQVYYYGVPILLKPNKKNSVLWQIVTRFLLSTLSSHSEVKRRKKRNQKSSHYQVNSILKWTFQMSNSFKIISGVPERDIELTLVYPKDATQYFYLEGKSLRLRSPIDRDPEDLASLQLEVRNKKKSQEIRKKFVQVCLHSVDQKVQMLLQFDNLFPKKIIKF